MVDPSAPGSEEIIAAGSRFLRAWQVVIEKRIDRVAMSPLDVAEIHEAALELISATETGDLQSAIDVVLDIPS